MRHEATPIDINHPGTINHPGSPTNGNFESGADYVKKALTKAVAEGSLTQGQATATAKGYVMESL